MGRLQRKKQSGTKKKNKSSAGSSLSLISNDTIINRGVPNNGLLTGVKKKSKSQSQFKQLSKKKTDTGKIKKKINQSLQFLREVKSELKKVTWPSRKLTMGSTVVVIILVIIVSFFLGIVDIGLSSLIKFILR